MKNFMKNLAIILFVAAVLFMAAGIYYLWND